MLDRTWARWAGPHARWHEWRQDRLCLRWIRLGSGPPLLLLHGYGGTARCWVRNIAALSALRTLYVFDLPGFGRSRSRDRFSLTGVADVLAVWMAAQDMEHADVLAHSMGGHVAMLLAARHPARVRSLVLAAPSGVPFTTGLAGLGLRLLRSAQRDLQYGSIMTAGTMLAGPRVLWQAAAQIRAVDVHRYATQIAAPTLILWGDADRLLPVANGPVLAAAIPGARLQVLAGGQHNLMFDQAARFNEAVRAFLVKQIAT